MILEIFSGSGRWSSALRRRARRHGCGVFEWDLRWHPGNDLTQRRCQQLIRGWINNGLISAIWLGTPCSSWSRARDRPGGPRQLRSDTCIMGFNDLTGADLNKVKVGNTLMQFTASILQLCRALNIPAAVENPHTSRLWLAPPMRRLGPHMTETVTDFCQDGTPWRKRTRFWHIGVSLQPACSLCSGKRGICSRTNKPHEQLCGMKGDLFKTAIAEPYPPRLCTGLANCYCNALAAKNINKWDLYGNGMTR